MSDVMSNSVALTDKDIVNFGKKQGIQIQIIELSKLNANPDSVGKFCAVFTGNDGDQYNTVPEEVEKHDGKEIVFDKHILKKHWLGLYGNLLFDSYGYQKEYTLPSDLTFTHTYPKRLQEYDSAVCGEYVCAFLFYCATKKVNPLDNDVGREFSIDMNFSADRKKNDETVLTWFKQQN